MKVSVVVLTTKIQSLVISSLIKQRYPNELIVVPSKGCHNSERNEGVRRALGDLVCFVHEDSIFGPNWVFDYVVAHAKAPDRVLSGGVDLEVENRPAWLSRPFEEWLSQSWVSTNNLCLHKDTFRRLGGFDSAVGTNNLALVPDDKVVFLDKRKKCENAVHVVENKISLVKRKVDGDFLARSAYGAGFSDMTYYRRLYQTNAEEAFKLAILEFPQKFVNDCSNNWFAFSELDPINRLKATIEYSRMRNGYLQGLMAHLERS